MSDIEYNTNGIYQENRASLSERVIDAWSNMRGSTRRLIDEQPSEARLFFYLILSDMIFFLSWSLKVLVAPTSGSVLQMPMEIGLWLVIALFCRSFGMYFFSILLGSGARVMGGTGTWKETRIAVFWGALIAAPFGFLFAIVTVVLTKLGHNYQILNNEWLALTPYWLSLLPFVWGISAGLAEAHGFKRTGAVFVGMALLAASIVFLAVYFRSQGIY